MKIIVVGEGKVGIALTQRLAEEAHDVTVIDKNADVLNDVVEKLDILSILGDGAALSTLKEADAAESDLLIAMTGADETNLLCCLAAKKLGCRNTIARVRSQLYYQQALFLKDELGLSMAVNPDLATAHEIFRMIQLPSFLKRESFAKGKVELVEVIIENGSQLEGKRLSETTSVLGSRVLICAVERNGELTIPNGSFTLRAGDHITVTAARTELASLVKKLGLVRQKIRSVMIIGGSQTAEYLTDELIKSGVDIKIIESNLSICEKLALKYPKVLIIHGDASRRGFLEAENVDKMDAVVTLTGVDEENLVISMYCNRSGVPKTITGVDRNEFTYLFADSDIGSVVCPKELMASEILRYVRSMNIRDGAESVKALHRIVDGKAEALEFYVSQEAPYIGIPISGLRLKKDMLLTCISRGNQVIIPKGNDMLLPHDTIIAVTKADRVIGELKDIFEKDAIQ